MATTSQLRAWWATDKCKTSAMEPHQILGRTTPVNRRTTEAWTALSRTLAAHGYVVRQSVWNYNCRKIAGTNSYSLHSYGLATDIDPGYNPFIGGGFSWSKTLFTKPQVDAVLNIETSDGRQVFTWGGYWRSRQDYMHWQIDVPPSALATGINWSTVDADEPYGENMPLLPIQYGHGYTQPENLTPPSELTGPQVFKREDVRLIQLEAGVDPDGFYGLGTAAAVAEKVGETDPVLVVTADVYRRLLGIPEHTHQPGGVQ